MHSSNFQLLLCDQRLFLHVHLVLSTFSYVVPFGCHGILEGNQVVFKGGQSCPLLRCLSVQGCPFCGKP